MTDYVVLSDHLVLAPVNDTSGPRRHRRGDVVDLAGLDPNEVNHLKAQGAVATQRSADGKTAAAEPSPPPPLEIEPPVIEPGGAASLVGAAVQSGVLVGDAAAFPTASVTDSGVPAKSATAEVWRAYAIAAGVLTEAEAADLSKAQLQEAVGRKAAAG